MCLKFTFASFRGKHVTKIHRFPQRSAYIETFNSKHNGHRFAAVITVATCGLILHLVASLLLHLLVLHPTLNRELQISVGTAGPQPRAPNFSGHCRTPTATADLSGHSQAPRAPDLSGHCHSPIKWGGASQLVSVFADLSRSFRGFSGHVYRNL